jgi:hypothetical protein
VTFRIAIKSSYAWTYLPAIRSVTQHHIPLATACLVSALLSSRRRDLKTTACRLRYGRDRPPCRIIRHLLEGLMMLPFY